MLATGLNRKLLKHGTGTYHHALFTITVQAEMSETSLFIIHPSRKTVDSNSFSFPQIWFIKQ